MSRNNRQKRETKRYANDDNIIHLPHQHHRSEPKALVPLNESQRQYISSLKHDEVVIGAGVAGTGKTYIAARVAAQLYQENKNFRQIIMTRPNVEVGRSLGFLPGEMDEKFAPYIEPFMAGMVEEMGTKFHADLHKNILPVPIAFIRGRTFDNSIILLDEAQNTTVTEMQAIITRVGQYSKLFITGDNGYGQNDLRVQENGLQWLIRQIDRQRMPIEVVEFQPDDCVRSGVCKMFLRMIERSD